jgi:hypothetical protein
LYLFEGFIHFLACNEILHGVPFESLDFLHSGAIHLLLIDVFDDTNQIPLGLEHVTLLLLVNVCLAECLLAVFSPGHGADSLELLLMHLLVVRVGKHTLLLQFVVFAFLKESTKILDILLHLSLIDLCFEHFNLAL